jgi:glutathione S-transferase
MTDYRLFGADTSPYSSKVRAFLQYKGVEFEWVARARDNEEAFQAAARVPTVPLLISPGRPVSQDSTAMLAALEADHPEPSSVPDDPACAALALVLEDYADEWLNKSMFQQRWSRPPDNKAAALRTFQQLYGGKPPRARKAACEQISARMAERLSLVGADTDNWETLETSYRRFALRLNTHLEDHHFIFGGRPSAADFAIAAQLQQMLTDPTPGEWLRDRAPFVVAWCEAMRAPKAGGPSADLSDLSETLAPMFSKEVTKTYLPWAAANAASASRQRNKFSVTLEDGLFEQATQRYAARAFRSVKSVFAGLRDHSDLNDFLSETGADKFLA